MTGILADTATDTPPEVIDRYLQAAATRDDPAIVACFTPDATVTDEGRTWRGTDEIRRWRTTIASRWTYTTTVTGRE